MDGPYYSPLQDIHKFDVSICIAGGVGITPYLAHLNHIRYSTRIRYLKRNMDIPKNKNLKGCLWEERITKRTVSENWRLGYDKSLHVQQCS